jgi:phosphoglycerate dehydrogenase-like enzyme
VTRLRVLEFVRDADAVWNRPGSLVEALRAGFPEVRFDAPATREEADRLLPEAEVVFGWAVTRDNLHRAKRLRWIHVSAAGVGSLLGPELVASDIVLTNGRGLHADAMAEHAIGMMLSFTRQLHLARDLQRERRWGQSALWSRTPGFGALAGSTLGLVGLGAVGSAVARRARALDMRVLAVRRHPASDPAPADEQWGEGRLGELLERSDFLVLAPPLTARTRGLIGAAELARMRSHAVLVNLGRGALVDEPALLAALDAGTLAGAALDVTRDEPLPAESPLWSHPGILLTPHVSGLGPRYWERAVEQFASNLRAWLEGRPLANVVDKREGY